MSKRAAVVILAVSAVILTTGCGSKKHARKQQPATEAAVVQKDQPTRTASGAPQNQQARATSSAQAKQHQKYAYHYFPDTQVYYDAARGTWYWQENNQWQQASRLPSNLMQNLGSCVKVVSTATHPASGHATVVAAYPGQNRTGHASAERE